FLADGRDAAESTQHLAGKRAASPGNLDAKIRSKRSGEAAAVDGAGSPPLAIGYLFPVRHFTVEFVAQFAEQFFEQVFQRHQTKQACILIDYQRHLESPAPHLIEQLAEWFSRRNEVCGPEQPLNSRRILVEPAGHQILGVKHADDIL